MPSQTDAHWGRITYEYDERGQALKMFDGLNNTVEFTYDYEKKLKSLKNERGYLTTFEYDELERPISQRNPLGQISTVKYDAVGNLTEATDELGRRTTLAYDTVNRITQVNYVDAQVGYTYDNLNRPTQVTDTQGGTINWSYDPLGQVLSETTDNSVVGYSYNDSRQRTSLNVQGRPNVNYGYDTAGRLSNISQGTESFGYSYDLLSRMESMTRPNGVTTSYEYDQVNRLKRLKHFSSSQTIEDLQYGYNGDDEIASISSLNSATLLPTAKTATPANDANRISQFGNASYNFDDKGQTTTKTDSNGTTTYNWDARGRMTSANLSNGQSVNYSYDALGRRSTRTANGQTTNFVYDGLDVVQDKQDSNVKTDYVNGAGIDDKLRVSNISGSLYFLKDHLGSTQGLTGVSGSVAEWQRYEAFGNSSIANSLTRYGFTGRERDEQTGLNYYRARFYDPNLGHFISEDPIGFGGGDVNLFGYVSNNPMNAVDPSGLYEKDVHYYLTYYLARKNGCFSELEAQYIAFSNQYVDDNPDTRPALGDTEQQRFINRNNHALNSGDHGPYFRQLWSGTTSGNNASGLSALGTALHYQQDVYSHNGYTNPIWGHLPGTHSVDKTDSDVEKAMRMAKASFDTINNFSSANCGCEGKWSSGMSEQIGRFAAAPGGNVITRYLFSIESIDPFYLNNKKTILGF
jgi:RHS repeat-associated protein